MVELKKNDFSIVTLDNESNIMIGNLEVVDREKLTELRNCLIKTHKLNYSKKVENRYGVGDVSTTVFTDDNRIKLNTNIFPLDDGIVSYTQSTYAYKHLYLLNLFNCLLGNVGDGELEYVPELFVKNGVFKLCSFNEAWLPFAHYALDSASNGNDFYLEIFKDCLFGTENTDVILRYNVQRVIPFCDYRNLGMLKKRQLVDDLCTSSLVLGTYVRNKKKNKK